MLTVYRILSYLLLPVAALFGLATLVGLLLALGNFSVLLSVFACGATTIYIIASFMFLQRVVESKQTVKRSLRDWVRANAFVAVFFSVLMVVQSVVLLAKPELMQAGVQQMAQMQQMPMPPETIMKTMKGTMLAMQAIGIVLLVHIGMGFRLLRLHQSQFV
jgi:hypothetical protein